MGTPPFCHSQVIPSRSADLRFRCEGRVWRWEFRAREHPARELCRYAAQVHVGLEPISNLPLPGSFIVRRCLAALQLRAGRESHDCCSPVSAGSKLNIHAVHPERPALPTAAAGVPRRPSPLAGHRRSSLALTVLARCRTARDSLHARRRSRAASTPSCCESLARARLLCAVCFGCVENACVCLSVVSSRMSECMVM